MAQSVFIISIMTICALLLSIWTLLGVIWILQHTENPHSAWIRILLMILSAPLCTIVLLLLYRTSGRSIYKNQNIYNNRLQNLILNESGLCTTQRNRVKLLHNASSTYCEIIAALHRARRSIHIAYYIIDCDKVGNTILDILSRKAQSGVEVCIIYDSIGSAKLSESTMKMLHHRGIQIKAYTPIKLRNLFSINRRNHSKLLIIDSQTLFLGGINIATRYIEGTKIGVWRDDHTRIDGQAALQAEEVFLSYWRTCGGRDIFISNKIALPSTLCTIQLLGTNQDHPNSIWRVYTELIYSAKKSIIIYTPYFAPTEPIMEALCNAAIAGISVEIIIPYRSDLSLADYASIHYIERGLRAGVTFHRYSKGLIHSKTILIDRDKLCIGSANMDYRSMLYNTELMAIIFSHKVVHVFWQKVQTDLLDCKTIPPYSKYKKSAKERLLGPMAHLLSPLL